MRRARHLGPFLLSLLAALPASSADAASWSAPASVSSNGDVGFALAAGADGTAALAWQQNGVQVSVRRPGHGWSAPRRIAGARNLTGRPSLAVTGRGEV